jgi:lipoprotein signal peptidase
VTDFLDFRFWPAFNLADAFIVGGVAVLIGALLLADREPRRAPTVKVPSQGP